MYYLYSALKYPVLILFFGFASRLLSQSSFYSVYEEFIKAKKVILEERGRVEGLDNKSHLQKELQIAKLEEEYLKKVEELPQQLKHLYFPDVQFSDIKFQTFMLSDLKGELIVNYNDPRCLNCIREIDSIRTRLAKPNAKLLVLFDEKYRKEISEIHWFSGEVWIGFVTADTKELISMQQGYNLVYVLDQDHQISFFGKGDKKGLSGYSVQVQN